MHSESETEYRLNRIFNVFNAKVYRFLILINIFIVLAGIWFYVFYKFRVFEIIFFAVVANLVTITSFVFHCPKSLSVSGKSFLFDDYIRLRPEFVHGTGFWWLKVSYSVTDIKNVKFHQNPIEKIFNVGHISFLGNASFSAKRDIERMV